MFGGVPTVHAVSQTIGSAAVGGRFSPPASAYIATITAPQSNVTRDAYDAGIETDPLSPGCSEHGTCEVRPSRRQYNRKVVLQGATMNGWIEHPSDCIPAELLVKRA